MVCCTREPTNTNDYEQVNTTTVETNEDEQSMEDDLRILEQKDCSGLTALLSSPASRASYTSAMHCPSTVSAKSKEVDKSATPHKTDKNATIKSLMSNKSTRVCLIAYWTGVLIFHR